MLLSASGIETRWAVSDGHISIETVGTTATASCRGVNVEATVSDGTATVTAAGARMLMPRCGRHVISWDCGVESHETVVERVGARYCSKEDIVEYGKHNNDGFDDSARYPDGVIQAKIQEAEEAIERGCRRSFCERTKEVRLVAGRLNELPVVDALAIDPGHLESDRQATCDEDCVASVRYGASLDARIRAAAVQLAASYLRPRVGAENARGASVDGVFVSYDLATGADGHWTGLPAVDAVIEDHRSRRVVIA